jgi:predicted ATPase
MSKPVASHTRTARMVPFISRVRLENYKSIAECDVRLGPLTILVGPNGSGKSNFLDALGFLAEALATSPGAAVDERGGLDEVVCRVPEPAKSFRVAIEATVPWGPVIGQSASASYEVEVGPSIEVNETCCLRWAGKVWRFRTEGRNVFIDSPDRRSTVTSYIPRRADYLRPLYLPSVRDQPAYAPLYGALRLMQFYAFDLAALRRPGEPKEGAILGHAGEHLGDVLTALDAYDRGYKQRVDAYLRAVVPGIGGIDGRSDLLSTTVALRMATGSGGAEVEFGPRSVSDGTIRAAAVLAALFQAPVLDGRVRLIGIEEPEIALHPGAAGVLFDAITEASDLAQVIITSQSADLLDRDDLDISSVHPVTMREGLTVIGDVDDASREIAGKKLYTLGELMRGNQLTSAVAPIDHDREGDA